MSGEAPRPSVLLVRGDEVVQRVELGERPLHVGRAPGNDLVLGDDQVSWRHLMLWVEGARVWVRDLGSTNGTQVDGQPLSGAAPLDEGASLSLGGAVTLRVEGAPGEVPVWMVEDGLSGVRHVVRGSRFVIGPVGADLAVVGAGQPATLFFHGDEVWLGIDDDDRWLDTSLPLDLFGRTITLVRHAGAHAPTAQAEDELYPYTLDVDLAGSPAPSARVHDLASGIEHVVKAQQRVSLLYVLARQLERDRAEGLPSDQAGWCANESVASGVWGRKWQEKDQNLLHVLVHRVRAEVKKSGLDPWFIEKRQGFTRARVRSAVLRS